MRSQASVEFPLSGGIGPQNIPIEHVLQARRGGSGDYGRGTFEMSERKSLFVNQRCDSNYVTSFGLARYARDHSLKSLLDRPQWHSLIV